MRKQAVELLHTIPDERLTDFAVGLGDWLLAESSQHDEPAPMFTESRGKALLRAAEVIDLPTLDDFGRLIERETAVRLFLFDLLQESELAHSEQLPVIGNQSQPSDSPVPWLSLTVAAFAWKTGYPLHQLDPETPPDPYSPAGQVVRRAAHLLRRQVQRSATERDKMAGKLAYRPDAETGPPSLDTLQTDEAAAPLPPHYRAPIPVRYPEYNRETIQISDEEAAQEETAVTRNDPITITEEDLADERRAPTRGEPIRISREQVSPPRPRTTRSPAAGDQSSRSSFGDAVRNMFGSGKEPLTTTKLRVIVQEYPDGPGLYGLQVEVRCKGIKSFVAGTTNRDGHFLCELPVRVHSGLTYQVDVTWPRDFNSEVEQKAITLNTDRTEFILPFYQRHSQAE